MLRISLLNMPFANLALPSLALTQIEQVLQAAFRDRVFIEIIYINQDFGKHLGPDFYAYLATSMESLNAGLGDWFFRQEAFPALSDNFDKYFERYFPSTTTEGLRLKSLIAQKRLGLGAFLDDLISKYALDKAHIVGFTSMFMQNVAIFAMARKLKKRNPDLITVMGGANCEFPMGSVIARRANHVDFVFSGPALKSFPDFVGSCLAGEMSKCLTIPGVFTAKAPPPPRTMGEEVDINTPIELDYGPFLDSLEKYFPNREVTPVLTVETSRGCWWGERAHCTFCGLNGTSMAYRAMIPDMAIKLFKSLFRYSGRVSRIMVVDNILPKNYISQVLPLLDTPSDMQLFYEVKADLDDHDMGALARARVKQIQPGIESLATTTLKLMKKGTTVFQNLRLLKLCSLYDIEPHWNLLVGFPGEDEDVYRKYVDSIPLLTHLHPPSGAYPVRFDRFSPYHSQADRYGLRLRPLDFYSLIYPWETSDLTELAYYFSDHNLAAEYFITMVKWLGKIRARVAQWQKLWHGGPKVAPRLQFSENGDVVYDSRSGATIEHQVGETGKAVLMRLGRARRIDEMLKTSKDSGVDTMHEIARLKEKGLLFEEDDRLFSLVVDRESENCFQRHLSPLSKGSDNQER